MIAALVRELILALFGSKGLFRNFHFLEFLINLIVGVPEEVICGIRVSIIILVIEVLIKNGHRFVVHVLI